jgi:hypothetical protein
MARGPFRQLVTGFSLLMALSLAGCATAAQRQAQQSSASTREAAAQFKACGAAIIAKPEYAALLRHYPEAGQPTMAQLTDETFISPEEATLFAARHDELNPCKTHLLSALAAARPDLVPIFADLFSNGVAVSVQLVERKITWEKTLDRCSAFQVSCSRRLRAPTDNGLLISMHPTSKSWLNVKLPVPLCCNGRPNSK